MAAATLYLPAQDFGWVRSFGGRSDDTVYLIAADAEGNIYTAGDLSGTVDFDPGPGVFQLTSAGETDVFVQKMDAGGNFLWAKSFGGSLTDAVFSLHIDAAGNVYTTGEFQGTVDFDPDSGVTGLTASSTRDVFVHKMDASGNLIWVRAFGGYWHDTGHGIATDAAGNVYTTGKFSDVVDADPGPGVANLTPVGFSNIFVQKMDAYGHFRWAKSFGNIHSSSSNGIATDASGNVYCTGSFRHTMDFDPGPGVANLTSKGDTDVFIQKMDSAGNFIWAKSWGGSGFDEVRGFHADEQGNIFSAGFFQGTADFDPGPEEYLVTSGSYIGPFIHKMDASGTFRWASTFGTSELDEVYGICTDRNGNVYTTGRFTGTVDFDPGLRKTALTSAGGPDAFVQKMDPRGNFLWARSFGVASTEYGYGICADDSGNLYSTGKFNGPVDFDTGPGVARVSSNGSFDVFVLKLSQGPGGNVSPVPDSLISVYPNPCRGVVQLSLPDPEEVVITLTDGLGKIIYTLPLNAAPGTNLEIPGPAGLYFLGIRTARGHSVLKLVKE